MLKPRVVFAILFLMLAGSASAIDPACDATGRKYSEMLKNGKQMSKQDEACFRAVTTANLEASRKAIEIPKVTTAPAPSTKWLFQKPAPASAPK